MKKTGLIHIYTGDGKGKTTASVGLAVRALGRDFKVCYSYFHKRPEKYGYTEIKQLEKLGAKIYGFTKGHPFFEKEVTTEMLKEQCLEALDVLKENVFNSEYDMLIMDEIMISVRDGFLEEKKLIDFIKNKPETLELVLTGRGATENIINLADYVSNVTKVKHPIDKNITSRKGIEF